MARITCPLWERFKEQLTEPHYILWHRVVSGPVTREMLKEKEKTIQLICEERAAQKRTE